MVHANNDGNNAYNDNDDAYNNDNNNHDDDHDHDNDANNNDDKIHRWIFLRFSQLLMTPLLIIAIDWWFIFALFSSKLIITVMLFYTLVLQSLKYVSRAWCKPPSPSV